MQTHTQTRRRRRQPLPSSHHSLLLLLLLLLLLPLLLVALSLAPTASGSTAVAAPRRADVAQSPALFRLRADPASVVLVRRIVEDDGTEEKAPIPTSPGGTSDGGGGGGGGGGGSGQDTPPTATEESRSRSRQLWESGKAKAANFVASKNAVNAFASAVTSAASAGLKATAGPVIVPAVAAAGAVIGEFARVAHGAVFGAAGATAGLFGGPIASGAVSAFGSATQAFVKKKYGKEKQTEADQAGGVAKAGVQYTMGGVNTIVKEAASSLPPVAAAAVSMGMSVATSLAGDATKNKVKASVAAEEARTAAAERGGSSSSSPSPRGSESSASSPQGSESGSASSPQGAWSAVSTPRDPGSPQWQEPTTPRVQSPDEAPSCRVRRGMVYRRAAGMAMCGMTPPAAKAAKDAGGAGKG
ncbi:hypothetical protein DFJ73DRAFT_756841, partial [Zopfochytrium polystomum]